MECTNIILKASFQNIGKQIEELIREAQESIDISVAWFTNKELLGLLVEKVKLGVKVNVIVSDDIANKRLNPKEFIRKGGKFYIMQSGSGRFLHDKFALFDNKKILTGSYNWTYFAEYKNYESVIVSDSAILVKQFNVKFKSLLKAVEEYEKNILSNDLGYGIDELEGVYEKIEKELEEALYHTITESKKMKVKINFDFIFDFVKSYGAIGACKRLMASEKVQSGFMKLWEKGRLDLTFESVIVDKRYRFLFEDKVVNTALVRLEKFKIIH